MFQTLFKHLNTASGEDHTITSCARSLDTLLRFTLAISKSLILNEKFIIENKKLLLKCKVMQLVKTSKKLIEHKEKVK